jgi:UDP-glucose 4-epimerase
MYSMVGVIGDVISAYADTNKVNIFLEMKSEHPLKDALYSAWKWKKRLAAN